MLNELKHAVRTLRRTPGFTVPSILVMTIGIGASTAVFTMLNSILLRPLGFPDSDRLVTVEHTARRLQSAAFGQSNGTYLFYQQHNQVFEQIGSYYENAVNLTGVEEPERIDVAMASRTLFLALGARPVVGRLFNAAEGADDQGDVPVIISYELWQRHFGADPAVTQRTIEVNRSTRRVIGVMPRGFDFPRPETQVWYPDEPRPAVADAVNFRYNAVARLRPGVSATAAEAHLNQLLPGVARSYPAAATLVSEGLAAKVTPLKDVIVGPIRSALWLLMGSMLLVLAIACANAANLMLVRTEHRQREIAVRIALGARLRDLARLFHAETALVALSAASLGLWLAYLLVRLLVLAGPANIPRLHEVRFDLRVYSFALAISLLSAIAFGVVPLLRGRFNLGIALKSGGQGSTADRERGRTRAVLVIAQMALALVLLIGSGLLVQSFIRLQNADAGFSAERVMTLDVRLPYRGYESYEKNFAFWNRALPRIRALPGVQAAGAGGALPLVPLPSYMETRVVTEATTDRPTNTLPKATIGGLTDGYLEAMQMRLLSGSYPDRSAGGDGGPVLLSAALARRLFPNQDAVGKRMRRAENVSWNVVAGVVNDVPRLAIGGESAEILYLPVLPAQVDSSYWPGFMTLTIRTAGDPNSVIAPVRSIIREVDPYVPLHQIRPMENIVARSMARTSFAMILLLLASGAALLLGVIGIYAVVAYSVSRRTRELGIRVAVGARSTDLLRLVLGQAMSYAVAGTLTGIVIALVVTRWLRGLLFEVAPTDPLTIAATVVLLLAATILASTAPARRAARVDPIRALKTE